MSFARQLSISQDPSLVSPFSERVSDSDTICVVNAEGRTGTFIRDVVGVDLPPLGSRAEGALDAIVAWHEVGHAIHETERSSPWGRRAAESWCDLLGCAAALASGHDPACVSLYSEVRRLCCAVGPERSRINACTPLDEVVSRVLRPVHYGTSEACQALAERWRGSPWGLTLADLLAVCDEVQETVMPPRAVLEKEAMGTLDAWFFRNGRCIRPLDDHTCAVDLGRVVVKGVDVEELAREMAEHVASKRDIQEPRQDLPGGGVAHAAWTLVYGVRNAVDATVRWSDDKAGMFEDPVPPGPAP